jgi:hypothetical protein
MNLYETSLAAPAIAGTATMTPSYRAKLPLHSDTFVHTLAVMTLSAFQPYNAADCRKMVACQRPNDIKLHHTNRKFPSCKLGANLTASLPLP